MPPAHNLVISLPPLLLLYGNFVATTERIFGSSGVIKPDFLRWEVAATTTILSISIVSNFWQLIWSYYSSPGLTLDIFPFSLKTFSSASPCHGFLPNESTWYQPWEVTHLSFSTFWSPNSYPGTTLILPAYGLTKRLFLEPATITQSNIHLW